MNDFINIELHFFLISILWGIILLVVYDLLRIVRRIIKHHNFVVVLEDLIFWVLASLFIFAMLFELNNGIIRGFSMIGMLLGMILYHYSISEGVVKFVTQLIHTLLRPFHFVIKKLRAVGIRLAKTGKKIGRIIVIRLQKSKKSFTLKLEKKRNVKQQKHLEKQKAKAEKKQEKKERNDKNKQIKEEQKAIKKKKKTAKNKSTVKTKKKRKHKKQVKDKFVEEPKETRPARYGQIKKKNSR